MQNNNRLPIFISLIFSTLAGLLISSLATPHLGLVAGISLFSIACWATKALQEFLVSLILFLFVVLTGIATPEVIFAGFYSKAFWLVFGSLVLVMAVSKSGVANWVASHIANRFSSSYNQLLFGMMLMSTLLAFVMPSTMGRIMLTIPILLAIIQQFQLQPGSQARDGLIIAVAAASYIPGAAILTANVPNQVLIGAAETQYGISYTYAQWLLTFFPIMGGLKILLMYGIARKLFAETLNNGEVVIKTETIDDPVTFKKVSVVLMLCLLLWITDTLHGISPAWISLAAAVFFLLPGIGVISAKQFQEKMNIGALLFLAGILGLGSLVSSSGLGNWFGEHVVSLLPFAPGVDGLNYMLLYLLNTITSLLTAMPGMPAVQAPIAAQIAQTTQWSVDQVLIQQVVAFGSLILPYQIPPFLLAMQLTDTSFARATKYLVITWLLSSVTLVPLQFVWMKLLGVI